MAFGQPGQNAGRRLLPLDSGQHKAERTAHPWLGLYPYPATKDLHQLFDERQFSSSAAHPWDRLVSFAIEMLKDLAEKLGRDAASLVLHRDNEVRGLPFRTILLTNLGEDPESTTRRRSPNSVL